MCILLATPPQERLNAEESAIFSRLTQGLTEDFWNRWEELRERAATKSLAPEEQREREEMIPALEQWHLTCIECILKLAQIRGENPHHTVKSLVASLA
jgi:hypothetical protein